MPEIPRSERHTQNRVIALFTDKARPDCPGKHPSCPFNPLVANAFFRAGYIESWRRGIEKIRQDCLGHNIEPPLYDFGMAGLMLAFHANPERFGKAGEAAEDAPGKPSMKTSVKILELLRQNPEMTFAEVASLVDRSLRAVELASSKLVKAGKLKHEDPQKGGHRKVMP